jgi:hypothetical protein
MANVEHGDIVDYAMPMMKIEILLRRMHDLCLAKKYTEAGEICPVIITESRVLAASLALMDNKQEKSNEIPHQDC